MYDYMKALQRQFETTHRSIQELSDEVNRTHRELTEEPMYSFAKEEEERACRKAQVNDENDTET